MKSRRRVNSNVRLLIEMKTWLSLMVLIVAFGTALGQKPNDDLTQSAIPVRVQILANGTISLGNEPLGSVGDLGKLKERLEHIFAERKRNGVYDPEQQRYTKAGIDLPVARKLIVQAEEIAEFADVLRVLRLVRNLGAKPLDLQLGDTEGHLLVAIPVFADADDDIAKLKPNPLTLVVSVRANEHVALNGDEQESFEALLGRLRELFRRRTEMKAYKPGSSEIVATLFLKADPSLSLSRVVNLLRELKRVGANPLGLQIDDLNNPR
jgi:biopolymer transport protein ExbD